MSSRATAPFALICLAVGSIAGAPLSGTKPWTMPADPARDMVAGLHRYLDRETQAAAARRDRLRRGLADRDDRDRAVEEARRRLATILGAVDRRESPVRLEYVAGPAVPLPLVAGEDVKVFPVRWTVYPGFQAEGLWIEPTGEAKAVVVAIPDAEITPEQFAGITPGLAADDRVALRLARSGCRVLVPTLIDRSTDFSGSPLVRQSNLSHREWIYRMAYESGRHVIGYEVDEVRAAIDWLTRPGETTRAVGLVGRGEGGRIALYAAALDTRVTDVWIAGAFGPREGISAEPVDRNLHGILGEFGDAEIAGMVLPRRLMISDNGFPVVPVAPPSRGGRDDAAPGKLAAPDSGDIRREVGRLEAIARAIPGMVSLPVHTSTAGPSDFLVQLGLLPDDRDRPGLQPDPRPEGYRRERMGRLVRGMVEHTQAALRTSSLRREAHWSQADRSSVAAWSASTGPYREEFWRDILGKFPPADAKLEVESSSLDDLPRWSSYAVRIPVWDDAVASGILLLPKDLKPGERRPVVVCQHGLEGTPGPVVDPMADSVYRSFGAQLADRGYIVYAPQNPYIGHDQFRQLQRKANPLGKSLFGLIVRQHERTLEWLRSRPEVDPTRIAFYGLSYGGKTAMRVPAVLDGYCLSICSADFNEWVAKCTTIESKYSYLYTPEYDMYEFGLAERFNYAEMASLIAPRPFMVERGHDDGVAPDEWIGYEFAKVRRTYDKLGIGDRAELAVFNGGHRIDGKASFAFLAHWLDWPRGLNAP